MRVLSFADVFLDVACGEYNVPKYKPVDRETRFMPAHCRVKDITALNTAGRVDHGFPPRIESLKRLVVWGNHQCEGVSPRKEYKSLTCENR